MRPKLALMTAVAVIVSLAASNGRGSARFYYGGFHVQALPEKLQEMKDSLRFNLVFGLNVHYYIDTLANASLQVVAEQPDENTSPTFWSKNSRYTVWEAEGLPGSYYGFTYTGGTLSSDPSASGGKAQVFTPYVDQPGVIQNGPDYYQEFQRSREDTIEYTAVFRIKSPTYNPRGISAGDDTLCVLMVVGQDSLLAQRIVYASAFKNYFGYKEFNLTYRATHSPTEFRIYWPGRRVLGIDYVKVHDELGERLMSGFADSAIIAYVNQDWVKTTIPETGDTVIHRWYLKDEPSSIDCYAPYAYIDAILQDTVPYIPGAQFFANYGDTFKVHDYLLRSDPVEYMIDPYPFRWDDSPSNYQVRLNGPIKNYYEGKLIAESRDKDFWVAVQAHLVGRLKVSTCDGVFPAEYEYPPGSDSIWCCHYRDPTPNEIRLQTFLCMCHGADAVMYYKTCHSIDVRDDGTWLETGLYDQLRHLRTPKWDEVIGFTGPRVEKIGPIIANLAWQGACFHDTVGSFVLRNAQPSYIDSIVGIEPESTYVQVGFFEDDTDTSYFMLVNRQCLEGEDQNVIAYIDNALIGDETMWYVIDQYSQDTTFTGAMDGTIPFTTHLEPGEGKLFKLAPFPDSAFHGTAHPLTW